MIPVGMEFCHSCLFGPRTPEAYEILFEEILSGEQSISVRSDEIESAWNIIEQINAAELPVYTYQKKSNGPIEMQEFEKKHTIRWKE
jgi:glucose-6-phosphate 1-dehydrogenase